MAYDRDVSSLTSWLRSDAPELLDREGLSERGVGILRRLERFNRQMGWTQLHLRALGRTWDTLGRPEPYRIVDVGAGTGALLDEVWHWAQHRGIEVSLTGVELSPHYARAAETRLGDRATVVVTDARDLDRGGFHVATSALTLHHLPPDGRGDFVAAMSHAARRVYLFDLVFAARHIAGAYLLAPVFGLGGDALADGVQSVRRAVTTDEFDRLVAGLPGMRRRRIRPGAICTWPHGT